MQAYYVTYHAFHAYLAANGEDRPDTHSKTQRMFADRWAGRTLDLPPWTFAAAEERFRNGPGRPLDLRLHQWTTCDTWNCWDLSAKALKSTREEAIPESIWTRREAKRKAKKREWAEEEQARIAQGRRPRRRRCARR